MTKSLYVCTVLGCGLRVLTEGGAPVPHSHNRPSNRTRISWMSYGPTLLQQTWDKLDFLMDELKDIDRGDYNTDAIKGEMRGVAFVLSLFMQPHFTTVQDIAREAKKRYEMRQAGEEYESPGLGSRTYEPPPNDNKYAEKPVRVTKPIEVNVSPEDKALIIGSLAALDNETLAIMFSVPEDYVQSLR